MPWPSPVSSMRLNLEFLGICSQADFEGASAIPHDRHHHRQACHTLDAYKLQPMRPVNCLPRPSPRRRQLMAEIAKTTVDVLGSGLICSQAVLPPELVRQAMGNAIEGSGVLKDSFEPFWKLFNEFFKGLVTFQTLLERCSSRYE